MSDGGKGSNRRPGTGYAEGHERIWGKKAKFSGFPSTTGGDIHGEKPMTPVEVYPDNPMYSCENETCSHPFCNCEVKHDTK